ncbi:MAG: fasciclin domain-containing protein [Hyphomonadaceae bacterium]|nr:fasciclin domain-containing protein [Hyphomonadaceae bacterium]
MYKLVPLAAFVAILSACSEPAATPADTMAAAPAAVEPAPAAPMVEAKDIVDTAVGAGSFSTLVAAVQAAGLESTLRGAGPFTVFAPTDAAFAALPAGTVEDLLKPENKDKLTAILTYHVLPGEVMSSAIAGQTLEPATVRGATLKAVGGADGSVMINDAKVVTADIDASNGVIHVIDKVIMPPAK